MGIKRRGRYRGLVWTANHEALAPCCRLSRDETPLESDHAWLRLSELQGPKPLWPASSRFTVLAGVTSDHRVTPGLYSLIPSLQRKGLSAERKSTTPRPVGLVLPPEHLHFPPQARLRSCWGPENNDLDLNFAHQRWTGRTDYIGTNLADVARDPLAAEATASRVFPGKDHWHLNPIPLGVSTFHWRSSINSSWQMASRIRPTLRAKSTKFSDRPQVAECPFNRRAVLLPFASIFPDAVCLPPQPEPRAHVSREMGTPTRGRHGRQEQTLGKAPTIRMQG